MDRKLAGSVTLEAGISPSEDPKSVAVAVANVLGGKGSVRVGEKTVRFASEDIGCLASLHDQFRDRHIRAAAKKLLVRGRNGNVVTLMLNRQAAYAGVVALCGSPEESPLGPIYLTVESKRVEEVIDWLTAYEEG